MYSEHLIASLLELVAGTRTTGTDLDAELTRQVITVGRMLAPRFDANPNDAALTFLATAKGTPTPIGTRGAVHLMADGRTAVHLGADRGAIETSGLELVIVRRPEPGRYTSAWRLPGVHYGGLI